MFAFDTCSRTRKRRLFQLLAVRNSDRYVLWTVFPEVEGHRSGCSPHYSTLHGFDPTALPVQNTVSSVSSSVGMTAACMRKDTG
ncbi:hypothetical protein F7725_022526, partial [Dissostichus mawsoni]